MKSHLIELHALTRLYQMGEVTVTALDGLELAIERGEFIVLLGPSGSGKTTTLNLIGGLDRPTSGDVIVEGEAIAGYDEERLTRYRRRKVGFIFQFFNLIPTLTAAENVEFALSLTGSDGGRARELLELVGLSPRAGHFPAQLSGGEQQRVAIARALANRPRIILADEPTAALDSQRAGIVMDLLRKVATEQQAAILVVTHDEKIFDRLDRLFHLRDGLLTDT